MLFYPQLLAKAYLRVFAVMVLRGSPWAQLAAWVTSAAGGFAYTAVFRPFAETSKNIAAGLEECALLFSGLLLCLAQAGFQVEHCCEMVIYVLSGGFLCT